LGADSASDAVAKNGVHGSDVPFWNNLVRFTDGDRPVIADGCIRMTGGSGLGCELDEDEARKYAKPGEGFFDE
jgi:gluconate/galactonate dehydratase